MFSPSVFSWGWRSPSENPCTQIDLNRFFSVVILQSVSLVLRGSVLFILYVTETILQEYRLPSQGLLVLLECLFSKINYSRTWNSSLQIFPIGELFSLNSLCTILLFYPFKLFILRCRCKHGLLLQFTFLV